MKKPHSIESRKSISVGVCASLTKRHFGDLVVPKGFGEWFTGFFDADALSKYSCVGSKRWLLEVRWYDKAVRELENNDAEEK